MERRRSRREDPPSSSAPATPSRVALGRYEFDSLSLDDAVQWLLDAAAAERAAVVVTSNIQHITLAEEDATFREAVQRADLHVADGWPVVLASRLAGRPLPGRVAGVDLVEEVLAADVRLRVAILGGASSSAQLLAAKIGDAHEVVLVDALEPGTWDTPAGQAALQERLRDTSPTLTLLGLGAPHRELLAYRLMPHVRGPVICCGAAIDMLAGTRRRAPNAVRLLRAEWLFRAVMEPTRLGPRYARAAPAFARWAWGVVRATREGPRR